MYSCMRFAAEVDIPNLVNLYNRNIILHDVIVQLHSIFNSTNINHGEIIPNFCVLVKNIVTTQSYIFRVYFFSGFEALT